MQIETCASFSWSTAGSRIRPVKTRLRQFSLGRSAKSTTAPLQRVRNAAARLTALGFQVRDHVTAALRQLHWVPVQERIQLRLLSVHHGMCAVYLADTVFAIADNPTRLALRSADCTL